MLIHPGSSLAIVTAQTRKPVMPSNYTIIQYFSSFIEDPLFEDVAGEGKYASAKKCFEDQVFYSLKKRFFRKNYLQEFSKIITFCEEEISSNGPEILKAKLLKATFLVLTKQLPKALELLTNVIDEAKEDSNKKIIVNALVKRGSLYIQQCQDPQNDAKLSFADFNRAAELDPSNADVFFNRGQINLLMDKFDQAKEDLAKASELRPDFALANVQSLYTQFLASQVSNEADKREDIERSFKDAIEKYPDCIEAYALLAKVYQESGKLQEADELYKKGQEKNPENANLIVYRALLYLQQTGDVTKALEDMNKAVVMDDKCEFAFETIGQIEIQKGNFEGAKAAFEKVRIGPE